MVTPKLQVELEISSGKVQFYDANSRLLLAEGLSELQTPEDSAARYHHVKQAFNWKNGEAHYGLGQNAQSSLNHRGSRIELYQTNTKVAVPVFLSTEGYGILWDNYSKTIYNDQDSSYIWSEAGDKLRYCFMYGPDFDSIVHNYRKLTGKASMFPKWALGFIQSRNRYWTQEELLTVVKKYRQKNIPLDVIVLDYLHWENGTKGFGSYTYDTKAFPSPREMINTLHHKYHCKFMVSVWPSFSKGTDNWHTMKEKGYLLDVISGYNTHPYDAFNPAARELYWRFIKNTYMEKGVDALWLDMTEPADYDKFTEGNKTSYLGNLRRYANIYSLYDTKGLYNHLIQYNPDERPYILTRSGFAGQQKYGTTVWSGDIGATFRSLRGQIPSGLNFTASGLPYWTTDIGGYAGGKIDDPDYRELYVRWFQYGTFCPIFRTHGRRHPFNRKTPNELWSYGPRAESILTDYIRLRYRLMPYIYSLSRKVNSEGYTIMRPLAFNFRKDTNVYNINDQFLFGDALLINPVTEQNSRERSLYLPGSTKWYNFWTGQSTKGGQKLQAEAPLNRIPVFVQAGSIIPFGPVMQYATQKKNDPLELRIYTGKDGSFTLYEDENNGFGYQSGAFTTIEFSYNEENQALKIGERKGRFPGMLEKRTFRIVRVEPGNGIGVGSTGEADAIVRYDGKPKAILLK